MPEALLEDLQAKRDRVGAISLRMDAILHGPDGSNREYTDEEACEFDTLATEGKTLKKQITGTNARLTRQQLADDFRMGMDRPEPLRQSPENPEQDLAKRRSDMLGRRGRSSLKHFDNHDGLGYQNAYHAGLVMLATCATGDVKQWASEKCTAAGLDVRKLSPFQAEDGNVQGGYLVFPEFESTLIILREVYGVLEREAYKLPMASDTLIIPRRAGGTTVYYPGENGQLTESAMQFDQVHLLAKKYAQMTRWSTELNEDAVISMADTLAGEFAYQFAKSMDLNGFVGDGTSTYGGVTGILYKLANTVGGVSAAASLSKAASSHTTVSATTTADWNAVAGILPLYAENRAKWFMHRSTFYQGILPLLEAAGGNIAMYLSDGAPLRFLGYPVVVTQGMTTVGSQSAGSGKVVGIPAILGDMQSTSYMGLRRGVTVKTSDQRYIEFDQIAIQATQRVAINSVVGDPVDPANVPGPMVALQLYF